MSNSAVALPHQLGEIVIPESLGCKQIADLARANNLVPFCSNRGRGILLLTREQAVLKRAAADLHKGATCR